MTDSYEQALIQAKTDLAFALAQGDSNAEDEAAERIAHLEYLGPERWTEAAEVARLIEEGT